MKRLNVLMLNHNAKESGTYFRCFHFARQLVKRGHRVTLFTGGSNRFQSLSENIEGVRVVSTPRFRRLADLVVPGGLDTGFLDILIRISDIAFNKYDIIHGFDHLPNVSFPSYFGRRFRRACFISDWCDWWTRGGFPVDRFNGNVFRNRMETKLEEGIRGIANGVTTISTVLQQRTLGLGVAPEKIKVIPSGADIDSIRPMDKLEARMKLNLPPGARLLAFVGFVDQDVDLVLKSLLIVQKSIPQARALIVGKGDFALETARNLGIEDKVIAVGIKPYRELPDYFAASDVLAMPLRDTLFNRARWPNKLGDHLAAGRPTVTNPVGDIKDLFQKYSIGLLAKENDATDFAAQVTTLFEDQELCSQMGHHARALGEREYSWSKMTDQLESFYYHTLTTTK